MPNGWELPVSFYFKVRIMLNEFAFKEVSGLSTEVETESVSEGGVNNYTHLLPKQVKHGNLVLKRVLMPNTGPEVLWIRQMLEGDLSIPVVTMPITIQLLNSEGIAIYNWVCQDAYPVKWDIGSLDSEKNNVLIETLEFAYTTIKRL
ncbi:phage tail protein [Flavobacterium sp. DGU11]|uniref:Phage tail protein n=1 Tax=Flavobacterium arundinis TaxID=3139143 RepID=A0ABU9HRM8_9FLAO